jgi:hypothetical protein
MVPAVVLKVAERAPAATVTEAGVASRVELSETEITVPPVGAATDRVTVQVDEASESNELGLQLSPDKEGGTITGGVDALVDVDPAEVLPAASNADTM